MSLGLTDPIVALPGIGPARRVQLEALGIVTLQDLFWYAPFRYETVERQVQIAQLTDGMTACFQAQVVSKLPIHTPRFRSMIKVRASDATGIIELTWFNTPFILSSLAVGQSYYFTGKVSYFKNKPTLTNPSVEREVPPFGSLIPVYHESAEITSRFLRKLIALAFERCEIGEAEPQQTICRQHGLLPLATALRQIHTPSSEGEIAAAKRRLGFEEMYTLIQGVLQRKQAHQTARAIVKLVATNDDIKRFYAQLPFAPTPSQREAIQAISLDLVQPHPMQRLIQGEVGSGKTTVAAFALWVAARKKAPALLVCPTKILAAQHFSTLQRLLPEVSIGLYTSKEKVTTAQILVGTHALFNIKGLKPSLVVIDEEHRFGVKQREAFFQTKTKPHFLSMTATPIPRTVALTALADQDVSFIAPHKTSDNIKTWVTPVAKRQSAYTWIGETLQRTHGQAMIVCPFIEESLIETLSTVKSAKQEFITLKKLFTGLRLQLLHGSIKETDKQAVFDTMMAGKTDILVTTPVVEVGVDIPGANIIVIEGAERYGLAQLHQLRGRVGRRGQDAFCLLFTSHETDATKRLEYFASTYDGNALAEYDLKHRGSGELLGLRQHGFDTLKFASWFDTELISLCKQEAQANLEREK